MPPETIADRYRVLRPIGRGGMGTVWLCLDEVLSREVAVKQMGALPGEDTRSTTRAMREARVSAALNHENAVAVFDVVDHDGGTWLVMEYFPSQTLADLISSEGALTPARVAHIGEQVAAALASAHGLGIVHRDVKPGNVLVGERRHRQDQRLRDRPGAHRPQPDPDRHDDRHPGLLLPGAGSRQ